MMFFQVEKAIPKTMSCTASHPDANKLDTVIKGRTDFPSAPIAELTQ